MIITITIVVILIIQFIYNKFIKEHFQPTIYKLDPSQKLYTSLDECYKYCSEKDCLKLKKGQQMFNTCNKCKEKGLCLTPNDVNPTCDICFDDMTEEYDHCSGGAQYFCPNPENLRGDRVERPYFMINKSYNNVNSSSDDVCTFCWTI